MLLAVNACVSQWVRVFGYLKLVSVVRSSRIDSYQDLALSVADAPGTDGLARIVVFVDDCQRRSLGA